MISTADGAGILADILAHPGDDTPRLVYADWLEESGEGERAEFIRAQIELAACPEPDGRCRCGKPACRWCPIQWRVARLLLERSLSWLDRPCMDLESATAGRACHYRRGFVEAVRCTLDGWKAHGPDIVRAHPVREVSIVGREPRHRERHQGRDAALDAFSAALIKWANLPPEGRG
jgi:uncharacterized protein (TIGR02996 family)